jgi:hypothetical protein
MEVLLPEEVLLLHLAVTALRLAATDKAPPLAATVRHLGSDLARQDNWGHRRAGLVCIRSRSSRSSQGSYRCQRAVAGSGLLSLCARWSAASWRLGRSGALRKSTRAHFSATSGWRVEASASSLA